MYLLEPICILFTTGTNEWAEGQFGYVAKDKEERVLSVGMFCIFHFRVNIKSIT